ncbi:MAG: dicarboxylate/amino acid:cation symporter [Myxococcota bacterium]|nr:dicarboxylate/amino acid:cation symporter [Myxococcota bacterium]
MKIYTKILLGMAVGVILGLTVGPKSSMLDHDMYPLGDASKFEIRTGADQPTEVLALPKGLKIDFQRIEIKTGQATSLDGQSHEVPVWVKGYFTASERLLLSDSSGALKKRLGDLKPGSRVNAWLKLRQIPLQDRVQTTPVPVSQLGQTVISYLKPIGDLFMRLIKFVIVPLVFASLLVGIASLGDVRKLGRVGGKTLGLYIITTALAVTIGLIFAQLIQPGTYIDPGDKAALVAQFADAAGSKASSAADAPSTIENLLNIIPTNPMHSLSSGNMLQIIFFAAIFGIALTMLGEGKAEIVVTFFDRIQEAMVLIIHMVMAIAPYGVAALIADVVGNSGASILMALGVYALVVLAALLAHALLVYGGIVIALAKLKLSTFFKAIRPAQLIAFSTSSSSATLPVSMECAEENLGVSNAVSSFVLPLGSTVNMDGTALYQGVAALFIAQVFSIDLSLVDQLTIVLTATMASIGAAGVPGAGMVTLAMVLTATGIPQVGIALILGMDRLLDMFRTAVNVTGDLAVTSAMAVSEGEQLAPLTARVDSADPDRGFEGRLERDQKAIDPVE